MEKLLFGTAGIPNKAVPRTYENAFVELENMQLGGMEVEFVRGVNMNAKTIPLVKQLSQEKGLVLTAHAPYFINLTSPEEDKVSASIKRILDTARVSHAFGGYSIVFHAAYYMGQDKKEVYNLVKSRMGEIISTLKSEDVNIWVRPELTGKATQWGDLDELIQISNDLEMVLPVIDFAHLHARTAGDWNTYDEFARVFERLGNEIGQHTLENFHAHIAGIEYSAKGEKKHLMLDESDMNYKDLMKAFKDFNVKGIVICESPDMETDAILLQKTYESL
jgi:deoxyribonuclease-4